MDTTLERAQRRCFAAGFHLSCDDSIRGDRSSRRSVAGDRSDECRCVGVIAWLDRSGFVAGGCRPGHHGSLARQADFHPASNGGRNQKSAGGAGLGFEDPYAQVSGAPSDLRATDANRTKPGKENWLVAIGICTHLGCVPKGQAPADDKGLYGGWFCPCHGSMYDTAGRIRQGPAPRNLDIPPYDFIGDAKIRIG